MTRVNMGTHDIYIGVYRVYSMTRADMGKHGYTGYQGYTGYTV